MIEREHRPLTEQQLVDIRLNEIQKQIEKLIETVYLMGYYNGSNGEKQS